MESKSLPALQEGVYIHGLYLEGAGWSKGEKRLDEPQPKILQPPFPVLEYKAECPDAGTGMPGMMQKPKQDEKNKEKSKYKCPIYKYPKRNDKYLITHIFLNCEGQQTNLARGTQPNMLWTLKGTCLVCQKE